MLHFYPWWIGEDLWFATKDDIIGSIEPQRCLGKIQILVPGLDDQLSVAEANACHSQAPKVYARPRKYFLFRLILFVGGRRVKQCVE